MATQRPEYGLAPPASSVPRLRILVADGYADAADSTALLLGLWGHDVRVARTGPEALQAALTYQPDVVLTELVLPGLDGYRLARDLHAQGLAVVALTGWGDVEHRRRCLEESFCYTLLKPAPPEELQAVLSLLAHKKAGDTPPGHSSQGASPCLNQDAPTNQPQ